MSNGFRQIVIVLYTVQTGWRFPSYIRDVRRRNANQSKFFSSRYADTPITDIKNVYYAFLFFPPFLTILNVFFYFATFCLKRYIRHFF